MAPATKKINLALQGGGAHGAITWGVLDYFLKDARLEIDSICATGAGAINAVLVAQGLTEHGNERARELLRSFWQDLSQYHYLSPVMQLPWESWLGYAIEYSMTYFWFNVISHVLSPAQFNPFNYNPLGSLIDTHVDFEKINHDHHMKLFVCATNARTGKVKLFENHELTKQTLLASSCLPHLFQTVEIDGDCYWNGGYMGNPAIFPLIYNSSVSDILIVHINPIERNQVPTAAEDILNRVNEISFNSSMMREMRAIGFVTKLIDEKWVKDEHLHDLKRIYMHSLRTDEFMEYFSVASKLNTHWPFLLELFEIGNKMASRWLKQNFDKIGTASTVDLNDFL